MVWYYKEQAAQGNSAAILNLAVCHLSGVGMVKDSTRGVELMRDAAARGNAMAVREPRHSCIAGLITDAMRPFTWVLATRSSTNHVEYACHKILHFCNLPKQPGAFLGLVLLDG